MKKAIIQTLIYFGALGVASAQVNTVFKSLTGIKGSYPNISKDGKKVAFQSNRNGTMEIYKMDADGKNIKQLTFNSETANTPAWSPDGNQIVYCSEKKGDSDIWIMNADGSNQNQLTNVPGDDSHPKFSPDGKFIIFNSARTSLDLTYDWGKQWLEIFTMKTDGSDTKQITFFKTISTYPTISPDATKICFRMVTNEAGFNWDLTTSKRNSEVYVMNIDGTNPINISNNTAFDGWPTWTPDGEVIYSSNRGGFANEAQLYKANSDGKNTILFKSKKGSLVQASITSDGKSIYCYHNVEGADYEYGGIANITIQ